jgi:hypothetical protein
MIEPYLGTRKLRGLEKSGDSPESMGKIWDLSSRTLPHCPPRLRFTHMENRKRIRIP